MSNQPRGPPPQLNFPPPPRSATLKPTRKSKPIPFALNFNSHRPDSRSSSTSSITSFSKPITKPILKNTIKSTKRTRQWILLFLLLTSFSILILSTILAYCAALPHSDHLSSSTSSNYLTRRTYAIATNTSTNTSTNTNTTSPNSSSLTSEINAALATDKADQEKFSTPQARAALTFYTAMLPFLTILHTGIELLVSLIRPETSTNSRLGDILLFRSRRSSSSSTSNPTEMLRRRRTGTLLSFTTSVLLALGWLIIQIFTINCEIVTFGVGGEDVCPVQIRGHRMAGVSELSVGKVVLGFVDLGVYGGYAWYLVRVVGVFGGRTSGGRKGVSGFRRRARFVSGERGDGEREGRDDVERVGVELDGMGKGVVGC